MNELVISGVPYVNNESLREIISFICGVIKFAGGSDSMETFFRLPTHNIRRRSSPSIIIKFWGVDAKSDYFKKYFSVKKFCASMIGFAAPSRICINENLTKRNFDILCKARELKKDGKIARFATQRGRVVVKLQGSERSHTIDSLEHLSTLVQQLATGPMDN